MRAVLRGSMRQIGHRFPPTPPVHWLFQMLTTQLDLTPDATVATARHGLRFRLFAEPGSRSFAERPDYFLYYFGVWDYRLTRAVERLVSPGMTVIDGGANIGWYTLLLGTLVGSTGRVAAFEPDPRSHARLCDHVRLNEFQDRVAVMTSALGRERGEARLSLSPNPVFRADLISCTRRRGKSCGHPLA